MRKQKHTEYRGFRTAGIRLAQGRVFRDDPTLSDIPVGSEIVINERFARRPVTGAGSC